MKNLILKKSITKIIAVISMIAVSQHSLASVDCSTLKNNDRKAEVLWVSDGDSAKVKLRNGQEVNVRFFGVDTPESEWKGKWKQQAHSQKAKGFTKWLIHKKEVVVDFNGEGTYGRCVGEIFVNSKSVSKAIIESGHGWWYKQYAPKRLDLMEAQSEAKAKKLGLWVDKNPTPPWEYRRK